ncbi:MAG: threonylcarbamoyl-AMP synthase [Chloroflexi bacterium]|nr:threonylcarbamoyl-AMP synthase [Chloroflexota bacterium]
MKTKVLTVHSQNPEHAVIAEAARVIQSGRLAAFPTETVYGLGANALDAQAVLRIFAAKGRPSHDPLIVHIADLGMLEQVAREVPEEARLLAEHFWPGPLTLILPKHANIPAEVTAGLENVAVRMPAHPVALALIRAAGLPVAAPSANRFGHTSPTSAAHVLADLDGRIDMILDGGSTPIGVESTVLDASQTPARILRPGGVSYEALCEVLGNVMINGQKASHDNLPQLSPGMLSRHYAPRAVMILYESDGDARVCAEMQEKVTGLLAEGKKVGVICAVEDLIYFEGTNAAVRLVGSVEHLDEIARNLYLALRDLDATGLDYIVAREFGSQGIGLAIQDRLRRAATIKEKR